MTRLSCPIRALACALLLLFSALPARAQVDTLVTEGVVNAPVQAVWRAWTTSAGLQAWLAPHADIELRLGGLMRTQYDPKGTLGDAGTIENRVLAFEPERMLAIQVARAPEGFPFKAEVTSMWTVLHFQPTAAGGTQLRIVGMGFGADEAGQRMKEFFRRGNAFTLQQLQKRFATPQ